MRLNSNLVSKKGRQLSSTKDPNPKEVGGPSLQGVAAAAPFLPQGRAVTKETKLRRALLIPLPAPPCRRLVVVDFRRDENSYLNPQSLWDFLKGFTRGISANCRLLGKHFYTSFV